MAVRYRGRDGRYISEEMLRRMDYLVLLDRTQAEKEYEEWNGVRANELHASADEIADEVRFAREHEI